MASGRNHLQGDSANNIFIFSPYFIYIWWQLSVFRKGRLIPCRSSSPLFAGSFFCMLELKSIHISGSDVATLLVGPPSMTAFLIHIWWHLFWVDYRQGRWIRRWHSLAWWQVMLVSSFNPSPAMVEDHECHALQYHLLLFDGLTQPVCKLTTKYCCFVAQPILRLSQLNMMHPS